jgi:membrane protein DedA with SNARE-associated domain
MHLLAAAGSPSAVGLSAYLVLFAACVAGYAGVPVVGASVIGFSAVLASQGKLNIVAVLLVAAIGCEIGGLCGYKIGDHWGRRLVEHPGPGLAWRKKAVTKGEQVYQKWGRAAVFVTPSIVSGVLEMKLREFAVWNFFAGAVFVLSVGPAAYGAGKVSTGYHDPVSLSLLIGGIAIALTGIILARRHHLRHKSRQSAAAQPAEPAQPAAG